MQETFIDAFLNLKTLKKASAFKVWVKTIAIRKSIRYLKSKENFEQIEEHSNVLKTDWNEDFTAEHLHKAILSLPEKTRAVFVLIEVEGYKHKEVSNMLNITVGTSKSQLNYAKQILRVKLKEIYEG